MVNPNGLTGQLRAVVRSEGLDEIGTRNVPTSNGSKAKLQSVESIVDDALYRTAKFFRDTRPDELERACLRFREVRGRVTGSPMWSSEYDKEDFVLDPDAMIIERDDLYDKKTRAISESERAVGIRQQAIALVNSRFGQYISGGHINHSDVIPLDAGAKVEPKAGAIAL